MKRILAFLLFISYFQLKAQSVYVDDRKIYVDGQEYRINGICYARGEGNGENSGYSFNDDIPLLVDANINTIRTYAAITNVAELNAFANAGIKVIMMLNENSYTWYVNQFKDHPAILMWEFGNEFNYHPEWFNNNIQNWYNVLENCAATVKSLDPNHPVSTGHGEVPDSQALNSCPSVDVWGMNIYRWLSPDLAIDELVESARKQLVSWFGESSKSWKNIHNYRIKRAVPSCLVPMDLEMKINGIYRCGDYLGLPSIDSAMRSGRKVAESIIESFS